MAKISETPVQGDMNSSMTSLSMSFTASPVTKAKKLWRQKTILARENVITSPNLLEKFSGTHLNLNNAGICIFPVDILQQLTSLQMLYLDSNNLVELPDEIFTVLKKLKWLDVRNNHLVVIPSCVKGHTYLESLLLQGNNIEKLPLELGLVPNLKNLQVAHNPLTFPPKEILDLDCSRIINFLRTMWNKEHPNEIIELRKLSDHKIEKKPSTIICYQQTPLKKLIKSNRYSMLTPKTSKTSVRSKTWNYKPSSRYGSRKSSWALKRIDSNIETNIDKSIVICNFCAASLYRKGVFVENEICNDDCKQKVHRAMKKYQPQNFREVKVYSPETMTESNFLHLLGPSPRSLFIRKNLDFLVTAKQKNVKLCQIEPVDFNLRDYKKIKMKNIRPLQKANVKDRIFDVITNDRVKLKIKPMQLKEPEMMFNFLRAYLGITTERSYVKNKKKR